MYIAVVPPFFNGVTFTCGSLFVIAVPFTPVINFLKLKSNSFNVNFSKSLTGYLDVMAGVVTGKNDVLNGLEYHQCSETIIAVTDYILAVGKRQDMVENDYDIEKCELFYVPQGTVVELYATTLHYTPITVIDSFKTICLLLKGTGDACQRRGILKKKNKWFIAHKDNVEKVQAGDYPGLKGKMIQIKHL